jgi:PhnB protein
MPTKFAPPGWPNLIPRIVVADAEGLVGFLRDVFGATGKYEKDRPCEVWFGGSVVLISDAGARAAATAFLYVYVQDVDATYGRAVKAGARLLEAPALMPYGDRRAMVQDAWGNTWQIAAHHRADP